MYLLLFVCAFICGVHGQSEGVDLSAASSKLGDLDKQLELSQKQNSQIKDWKNSCREQHGEETVEEIEAAPKELASCVLQYVKPNKLQIEVNRSMAKGNLDLVFKKYCGYRINILSCVDVMLDKFRTCMTPQQLVDVNVTRRAVDAAIDFTCHDDGDRIALFMAEQGVECLKQHKDSISECVKTAVPELHDAMDDPGTASLDGVVINEQQCGKLNSIHGCIVQETSKCSDPTPANILDALITQMLKVTPCWQIKIRQSEQRAASAGAADSSSTSGASANIIGLGGTDGSGISALAKAALANIGPILASWVGGATGLCVLLSAVWSYLQALVSMIVSAGSTCSAWCTFIWSFVVDQAVAAVSALVRSDPLDNVVSHWKSDSGMRDWCVPLGNWWVTLTSCVTMSGVLMVALAGITAANLLL